jgi:hypothetical protein
MILPVHAHYSFARHKILSRSAQCGGPQLFCIGDINQFVKVYEYLQFTLMRYRLEPCMCQLDAELFSIV